MLITGLTVLFSSAFTNLHAQDEDVKAVMFEGRVAGYEQVSYKLLKNLKKAFDYKGGVKGVRVEVKSSKSTKVFTTGIDGAFQLPLKRRDEYVIKISKAGYSSVMFKIDARKIPRSYFTDYNRFQGTEFILVKGNTFPNIEDLGVFSYSTSKRNFSFSTNNVSEENWVMNNIDLAKKSVTINKKKFGLKPKPVEPRVDTIISSDTVVIRDTVKSEADAILKDLLKVEKFLKNHKNASKDQVEQYMNIVSELKKRLAKEKSNSPNHTTSMQIANLEAELLYIENQLAQSQELIDLKDEQYQQSLQVNKQNQQIIWLAILLIIIMVGALVYVITSLRFRREQNNKLETQNEQILAQNRRITDSLTFSASIQHSIFKSRDRFKSLFEHGVIFFKPKDIVSGDFYWFEEINGVKIIAVADCTGHGVPGALLTMLGNSFLNEIVKISGVMDPAEIVKQLNLKLIETFREGAQRGIHGMDISIIMVDTSKKELKYAGAMNSVYRVSEGKAHEHNTSLISLGMREELNIESKVLQYSEGDCFYLYSDGYSDQFGGDKNEKLNKDKFEQVLVSASDQIEEGEDILSNYFLNWKRNNKQIDDVLILGFKV